MSDTVDMVYVGDPPVIDEITRFMLAEGRIHPEAAAVLRGAEIHRCTAMQHVDIRYVDPEYFGTSKRYVFGPESFVVAVEKEDVSKIRGSASGHQWRVVGDPLDMLILPEPTLRVVDEIIVGGIPEAKMKQGDLSMLFR